MIYIYIYICNIIYYIYIILYIYMYVYMFYKVAPSNLQMGFQAPSPLVISIMKYFKTNFAISQKHLN